MGFLKTKIQKITAKIKPNNLSLLNDDQLNSEYQIGKLLDWQEDYDHIDFDDFHENYSYCNRCNSWQEDPCICYSR